MTIALLKDVSVVTTGQSFRVTRETVVSASVRGTNTVTDVSASIDLEGSNNNVDWHTLHTFNLTTTEDVAKAYHVNTAPFPYQRASVTAIGGDGAKVTVTVG